MKTLVIIPAYNEAPNIVHTVESLKAACPDVDYVVVNDCSGDDTAKICEEHGYTYLNLPINLGIGGGMQTGYRYAAENGYDIAIQMDGDGQHNAEYIPDLIAPIEKGEADLVIGSRFINKEGFQTSGMRRAGINILNTVLRLCGHVRVTDATSGFRAASRGVITFFAHNYARSRFTTTSVKSSSPEESPASRSPLSTKPTPRRGRRSCLQRCAPVRCVCSWAAPSKWARV